MPYIMRTEIAGGIREIMEEACGRKVKHGEALRWRLKTDSAKRAAKRSPKTIGESYLSRGMEGLVDLVDTAADPTVYCQHLQECLEKMDKVVFDERKCRDCIKAWLKTPLEPKKEE